MTQPTPSRTPMAGGFLLALSVIAGSIIGAIQGQPSIGFVAGFGAGLVLALLVWLIDKVRGN
jgi:hypothetical protein